MINIKGSGGGVRVRGGTPGVLGVNVKLPGPTPPAGPFSPDSLPNLAAWYKADAITPLSHGATVTSWPDSSGNGNDLDTIAGAPTYWDIPEGGVSGVAVDFDGSSAIYRSNPTGLPDFTDSKTVYIVLSRGFATSRRFDYRAFSWRSTFTSHVLQVGFNSSSDQQGLFFSTNGTGTTITTARPWNDSAVIFAIVYNSGEDFDVTKTYLNGVEATGGSASAPSGFNPSFYEIAIGRANAGSNWLGRVREVIVYSGAHDATARGQVESYLSTKWGIGLTAPVLNTTCTDDTYRVTVLDTSTITTTPIVTSNSWSGGNPSRTRGTSYFSSHYVVPLSPAQAGTYRFNLDSATEDTYMCLRAGPCTRTSTLISEDDDSGPGTNSQISFVYNGAGPLDLIVDCTTYSTFSGNFENFTLTITKTA